MTKRPPERSLCAVRREHKHERRWAVCTVCAQSNRSRWQSAERRRARRFRVVMLMKYSQFIFIIHNSYAAMPIWVDWRRAIAINKRLIVWEPYERRARTGRVCAVCARELIWSCACAFSCSWRRDKSCSWLVAGRGNSGLGTAGCRESSRVDQSGR